MEGLRPWTASGDFLRGILESRANPFRGGTLFDVEFEYGRQSGDHWIAFGAGATEEPTYHPRALAIAAMMDGVQPATLGRLDNVAA